MWIFEHTKNKRRAHFKFILSLYIPVVKDNNTYIYVHIWAKLKSNTHYKQDTLRQIWKRNNFTYK